MPVSDSPPIATDACRAGPRWVMVSPRGIFEGDDGASVRQVQHLLNPPRKAPEEAVDRDLLRLQEELSDGLGANVAIRSNRKGAGKVTIEFGSLDQLDGLISRLLG